MASNKTKYAPRPVTPNGPTLTVLSTTNSGGMRPGQQAVVEDNEGARRMLTSGLWVLLVEPEVLDPVQPEPEPEPTPEPDEEA